MDKTLEKIKTSVDIPDSVKDVYLLSFPPEERRPWESITALVDSGNPLFSLRLIKSDGKAEGLITTWQLGNLLYVEHFAVSPEARGMGLGGAALDALIAESGCPLLLEVEPEQASPEALRRVGFYQRHGFSTIDYHYVQPPYSEGLEEVELRLMSTSAIPNIDEVVNKLLHPIVYNKK